MSVFFDKEPVLADNVLKENKSTEQKSTSNIDVDMSSDETTVTVENVPKDKESTEQKSNIGLATSSEIKTPYWNRRTKPISQRSIPREGSQLTWKSNPLMNTPSSEMENPHEAKRYHTKATSDIVREEELPSDGHLSEQLNWRSNPLMNTPSSEMVNPHEARYHTKATSDRSWKEKSSSEVPHLSDNLNWRSGSTDIKTPLQSTRYWKGPPSLDGSHLEDCLNWRSRSADPKHAEDKLKAKFQQKIKTERLTIAKLDELKEIEAHDILLTVSEDQSGFVDILNHLELSDADVCLIMKLLAKACSNQTKSQSIFKLLLDVEASIFFNLTIPSVLTRMANEVSNDAMEMFNLFIEDILDFLTDFSIRMPHHIAMTIGIHSVIELSLTFITRRGLVHSDDIERKMKQLVDMKTSILKQMENDRLKTNRMLKSGLVPPSDYRELSIMPTYDDIYPTRQVFLRKITAEGGFSDLDEYLDIQFRLLREDFIQPLRQGINEYLTRTYHNVVILQSQFDEGKYVHTLTFDLKKLKNIDWEHTRRLKYGTLVCLSNDNFKTFSVATVVSPPKQQKTTKGSVVTVDIFIEPVTGEKIININIPMVMVETPVYFESYRHVLSSLQNIREGQLPFEDYIVHCKTDIRSPGYLRDKSNIKFDFGPVSNNSYKIVETKRKGSGLNETDNNLKDRHLNEKENATKTNTFCYDGETVDNIGSFLELCGWPQPEDLHLDATQFQAFQQALTKEFVLIQGPPGTGKTYVGLKIVKALLSNAAIWQQDKPRPILVVCYTNHALDQFLEGILSFYTGDLVRVGSRCDNQNVIHCGIKERRRQYPRDSCKITEQNCIACTEALHQMQKQIKRLYMGIIKSFHLKRFIKRSHYVQLTYLTTADDALFVWLRIQEVLCKNENVKICGKLRQTGVYSKLAGRSQDNVIKHASIDEDGAATINEPDTKSTDCEEELKQLQKKSYSVLSTEFPASLNKDCKPLFQELNSPSLMEEDESMAVNNVWSLDYAERWRLYRYWVHQLQTKMEIRVVKMQQDCIDAGEEHRVAKLQTDKCIMETCSVIGMTTTAAARYQKVLSEIKPRIVIIEEAAEILEGHVIAALSPECQHLILIGDHQQLRPSTNVYVLAKRYNLELSLFERMVKNGLQCVCLEKQHRMRPCISRIMKHIYPSLRDDASVEEYPNILGVSSNVFFISHSVAEETNDELKSHLNTFEARYVIALCLYLIKQGYAPNLITILTTYSAQVTYLKQNISKETFEGVKVTSVDNYQGEENDIILLSLVRSNLEGNVGFIKIDNRVCVALSRARKGLYVIGDFELLSKQSKLWKNIIDDLKSEGQIGPAIGLYCQNHPNDSGIKASKPDDFSLAPEGGCKKPCLFRLNCGHVCASPCHPVDPGHLKYQCHKRCEKILCDLGHQCPFMCYEKCKECVILVTKVMPVCKHEQQVPCSVDPKDFKCLKKCEKILCDLGHQCSNLCCKACKKCVIPVTKVMPICKHEQQVPCSVDPKDFKCLKRCENILCDLGHQCPDLCCKACKKCVIPVTKVMPICKHEQQVPCSVDPEDFKCLKKCEKILCDLGHQCPDLCYEECKKCVIPVTKVCPNCEHEQQVPCWMDLKCMHPVMYKDKCGHEAEVPCSKQGKIRCKVKCNTVLKCGHTCRGLCYECVQGTLHISCTERCNLRF